MKERNILNVPMLMQFLNAFIIGIINKCLGIELSNDFGCAGGQPVKTSLWKRTGRCYHEYCGQYHQWTG